MNFYFSEISFDIDVWNIIRSIGLLYIVANFKSINSRLVACRLLDDSGIQCLYRN